MASRPPVVVHNSLAGNDFIVRIGVPDAFDENDAWALAQWVGEACASDRHTAEKCWCITSSCVNEGGEQLRFDVLVHQDVAPALPMSIDGFLILSSTPRKPELVAAETLASVLAATPFQAGGMEDGLWPERVGVSAVSPAVMAKFWWSAIGGKGGLRRYRMLRAADTVRLTMETSGGFGWAEYPPRSDAELDVQFTW